jgi:glycine/D-amino acid oxidase-like deaminating enzyme
VSADRADVAVIGGGIVGVSAAYHLARAGAGRVVLLEREGAVGRGSTGACAGGFRHQFSSRINIELSLASIPMIVGFEREHGLPLDVWQDGYLFLVRGSERWEGYRAAAALQRSMGVEVDELTAEQAGALVPGVALDGVVGAVTCARDGIADPSGLTQGYATLARRAGAELWLDRTVTGVRVRGGRVEGVRTGDGDLDAPVVIDAAGPWAAAVAATAGVDLPIEPVPRTVVTTGAFPGVPRRRTLVIDAETSFYFHREGEGVLMGMGGRDERASFSTEVDRRFVEDELLPVAVRRFPPLERAGIVSTWAGLYEMTPDRHPIVGSTPVEGLLVAAGFSGHGFQHAPVVGKLLAELVVDGVARTVSIQELGLERFARGTPEAERNVV